MGTFIADLGLQILSFVAKNERESIEKRHIITVSPILVYKLLLLQTKEKRHMCYDFSLKQKRIIQTNI